MAIPGEKTHDPSVTGRVRDVVPPAVLLAIPPDCDDTKVTQAQVSDAGKHGVGATGCRPPFIAQEYWIRQYQPLQVTLCHPGVPECWPEQMVCTTLLEVP